MSLGTALRGPVARIIRQFGEAATWRRITSHYDPAQGRTVETTTDYPVHVVRESFPSHLVDGQAILVTDAKLMVAAQGLDVDPTPGQSGSSDTQVFDMVIVSGVTYRVHRAEPIGANGTHVVWQVHGRR